MTDCLADMQLGHPAVKGRQQADKTADLCAARRMPGTCPSEDQPGGRILYRDVILVHGSQQCVELPESWRSLIDHPLERGGVPAIP